jgi:hypothetical protein
MKLRFSGPFEKLQQLMALIGIQGEWRVREDHYQYRAVTGAILNWWKSTGTITFQGPKCAAKELKNAFLEIAIVIETEPTAWRQCRTWSTPTRFAEAREIRRLRRSSKFE